MNEEAWPPLPLADWKETYHSLHMWTQMVGKLQLALTPRTNHWWNVALHMTARGLTTTPMPVGPDVFTVAFDFVDQVLRIEVSRGDRREIPLVVVVVSGRPLILGGALDMADALVAAWLPGSEGAGVADVLFGDYKPTGKLSFSWPRSMAQIPINVGDAKYDPQFPFGFGLTY